MFVFLSSCSGTIYHAFVLSSLVLIAREWKVCSFRSNVLVPDGPDNSAFLQLPVFFSLRRFHQLFIVGLSISERHCQVIYFCRSGSQAVGCWYKGLGWLGAEGLLIGLKDNMKGWRVWKMKVRCHDLHFQEDPSIPCNSNSSPALIQFRFRILNDTISRCLLKFFRFAILNGIIDRCCSKFSSSGSWAAQLAAVGEIFQLQILDGTNNRHSWRRSWQHVAVVLIKCLKNAVKQKT